MTDEGLSEVFAKCGTVTSSKIITERDTGRSKGFGFVEMSSDAEASKAITELNGMDVGGRPLRVQEARPQEERPRGGFGGGGMRGLVAVVNIVE